MSLWVALLALASMLAPGVERPEPKEPASSAGHAGPAGPEGHSGHEGHAGHAGHAVHGGHAGHTRHAAPSPTSPLPAEPAHEYESHRDHAGHGESREQDEPAKAHQGHAGMHHAEPQTTGERPPAATHEGGGLAATSGPHAIERTPATAAIEPYFTSPQMERARAAARREMGGGRFLMLQADRLEWRSGEGEAIALFEGQGWYGGDATRFWVKTEAELLLDAPSGAEEFESAEVQTLVSRPVSPYFDLQMGIRHDLEPSPSRTFAVVGVQGLAPQWFEIDVALFLSEDGDLSTRLEAEYDMLLTQRLALQVRSELEILGSDVPELGLASGPSSLEAGLRLSYGRVISPYVGVSWEGKLGETADLARRAGDGAGSLSAVAGFRFWY